MKIKCVRLILAVLSVSLMGCGASRQAQLPTTRMSPESLKADVSLLKAILEKNHPSLYWYTTKDSLDEHFRQTILSITDSLTEHQFKNKLAWLINKIHCGHTAVRSSSRYNRLSTRKRSRQFPLSLKVWDDSMVLVNNSIRNHPELRRGTIITGINGYSNRQLLDSIYQFISTDGYTINFKQQIVSFNFPFYYANTFGLDSQYRVSYIDSTGRQRNAIVKSLTPRPELTRKDVDSLRGITRREFRQFKKMSKRSLLIDTSLHTAILKVNTFSEGHLQPFFRRTFRKLRQEKIENLVIDLRENGGGNIMSSTRLTQYLIKRPFKIADTVAAISRSFTHRQHIKPWFIYWLSMHVTGRKKQDGRIHFSYFENHRFKPKRKNHFDGKTYLVAGGYSFSAATLFVSALKGQDNVTVVGEETGGGSYGNTAMHLPVINLPNSKVRVILPLYRIVIDKNRPKTGRGIFPDIPVNPSSAAIRQGVDAKMEEVHELIISGKSQAKK
ncbi:hypothetical protein EXU57_13490 [Segetibacter sp. 3557_3]|uniref:S41 family peptidase n=1 Tax=Segetibacter sp. 3557_3 TaxID=2547429 RepID=UPI0010584740|nr:S41 family peptidase [Segetibacter sp. 3557_3]TDH25120.1 hypothetical protein EXU57_13490 [Segetibacter sp. 3557_3]